MDIDKDLDNTAQSTFATILSRLMPARTKEIKVDIALDGELDLSILVDEGFNLVRKLVFHPGKITSITHIPKYITKLLCPANLLTGLSELPPQLEELHVQENHLATFDMKQIPNIRVLNLSDNHLAILKDLPNTLIELYINNNNITQLDLESATQLEVLHCSKNGLMVLQNVPKTMRDLQMEHNPLAEIKSNLAARNSQTKLAADDAITAQIDYVGALNTYFKLKSKYDIKLKAMMRAASKNAHGSKSELRRLISRLKPPCINCKRNVKTIWSNTDHKYTAFCGDTVSPCNLKIELYRGDVFALDDLLHVYKLEIEQYKQSIIHQKMDTVFSYISEAKSVETFNKKIEEYTAYSTVYKRLLEQYDDVYHNMYKKEQLRRKMSQIYEIQGRIHVALDDYTKNSNYPALTTAMEIYTNDIIPEMANAQRLRYEVNEVVCDQIEPDKNHPEILVQKENALLKMEYSHSEPPKVVHFSYTM